MKSEARRNILVESAVIGLLSWGVYLAIDQLPLAVVSKSRAFILLGLIPNLLHAIYSVVAASSEFEARRADIEEMK
jgi:hypothetical protein